jgi:type III restriction enzyme
MLRREIAMNRNTKYIGNSLSLRTPQRESLEIFEKICDTLALKKAAVLDAELEKIKALFPTLTSFERSFPSVCFALATGIGKTRLMGAFIAYLYYEKGIKNFFVVAPNKTIYSKLKTDLGTPSNHKYVFKGLDAFVSPPRIIDGDNYEEFRQGTIGNNDIVINIFNIDKLNSDTKIAKDKPTARIKRLNEVLGESYFEYLKNLPDLCIFMDESHHYHADASFNVINDLNPILGVELTATPQIQKSGKAIPFKNVVYEYSLAHALKDEKYVKVPAVFTRKDFKPEQYTAEQLDIEKLSDGIKLHIDTKEVLDTFARTHGKEIVKPFMLVVAKDTDHSKDIKKYLNSTDFCGGRYKDKVLEIHSVQGKVEKDENIAQLLTLESPENKIEIVIHVNMLKEGWDVTNLYTIVPLRASASETLTEQTIGRGLRLPYGERAGDDKVDRLSIVSHDKYAAIIELAKNPNSLVRKIYYIDPNENQSTDQKETIAMPSVFESSVMDPSYAEQLTLLMPETIVMPKETKQEIVRFIAQETNKIVADLNKRVKNIEEVKSPEIQKLVKTEVINLTKKAFGSLNIETSDILTCVEKAVEYSTQMLTDKVIPIPQGVVQPISEIKLCYDSFSLETKNINWHPSDDTLIGTELKEDGETFDVDTSFANIKETDTPENAIVKHLVMKDNIDYELCSELMYDLIEQLKVHLNSYLHSHKAVKKVLVQRRKSIAENIYAQMMEHFKKEETVYTSSQMRPFSKIEVGYGGKYAADEIFNFKASVPASEVKNKIFNGFTKACHTMYKFDSDTERKLAIVLENDTKNVLRWLKPNIKQFDIYYDKNSSRKYEPDFIVETVDIIYMVETKDNRRLQDNDVVMKAKAAMQFCKAATEFSKENGGKPWEYALIAHDEVRINSSFTNLIANKVIVGEAENSEESIKLF